MKKWIQLGINLCKKYEDIIKYLIFGVLTTIVSLGTFYLFRQILGTLPLDNTWKEYTYLVANALSWVIAVAFAYVTNRIFVFKSQVKGSKEIFKEFLLFINCRLASGAADMAVMFLLVTICGIHDLIAKMVCLVMVVILNYVFSKLIIFKGADNNKTSE